MRSAGLLSEQRRRLPHSHQSSQAQMPRIARPVRRHSIEPDRLAALVGSGVQDAEALALALGLGGSEQLTEAWLVLPSRLLGPHAGELTYEEGVRLYLSQGAAMQQAAADRRQAQGTQDKQPLRVVLASEGDAGGGNRGLPGETLEQRRTAGASCPVEVVLQHLPDVESHLEPEALAFALSTPPTSTAAVHVAAVADAAWHRVPSSVLGPRPTWLDAYPERRIRQWRYGQLLQLSAAVGYERVRRALAQPCLELACLELLPLPEAERLKLDTAIGNLERIAGVSLAQLLERRMGKAARKATSDAGRGSGVDGELLQLQICSHDGSSGRAVEFSLPRQLPPPVNISGYQLPASGVSAVLLPWAEVRRGRDLFVDGWGSFPISLPPARERSSFLPTPAQVRAHGYAAALFPLADEHAARRIRRILTDPSSQLARYIVKWSSMLNGPLAARIDELEELQLLGKLDFDLPPETLLRRLKKQHMANLQRWLQYAHLLSTLPFERFDWLVEQPAGDEPRILASKTGSDGAALHLLRLTTSHQIALAGLVLDNCIGNDEGMLDTQLSSVRDQEEMLLVLSSSTDVQEARAMAAWTGVVGGWDCAYESRNHPIRPEWESLLLDAEAEVRRIWDSVTHPLNLGYQYYSRLMEWDHPRIHAALADSGVTRRDLAVLLSYVLEAMEEEGGKVQGSCLASVLCRLGSATGCGALLAPKRYCGYTRLKEFTQQLPFHASWDADGYVEFRLQ